MKEDVLLNKGIVLIVIVLFIGTSVTTSTATNLAVENFFLSTFDGNTLYVGGSGDGNYSSIQAAINDASDGDTVFVYNDSSPYYENVWVYKSIDLIGEDKDTTVIDGGGSGHVVVIGGVFSEVNLSGFTIQNSGDHWDDFGIGDSGMIFEVFFNTRMICGNNIVNNNCGISLYCSDNNIISENIISGNEIGIYLPPSFGICSNNTISNNVIINNGYGIFFESPYNNYIFHNDFVNNNIQHAYDGWNNIWDDGYPSGGNYWDDYSGEDNYHGPSQNISGSDGIGDTPYNISGGSNQDRYPFIEPYVIQSDLECEGHLKWTDVKPESTVNGSFIVKNVGDLGSLLDWEITEIPDWGYDWTFSPSHGDDLKPEDGPVTVEVSVKAHLGSWEPCLYGTISTVNKENWSDLCEIQVSLYFEDCPLMEIIKPERALYINNEKIIDLFFQTIILGRIDVEVDALYDISKVEFYIDDKCIHTDTTEPFSWTWDKITFFIHCLEVKVYATFGGYRSGKMYVWKFL